MNFAGKRAWVTGAGQGIGQRVAERLVEAGAQVRGLDRQFGPGAALFAQHVVDLADPAQIERGCAELLAQDGRLDVFVHAAGVLRPGNVEELAAADWEVSMAVNAGGAFHLLRQLLPLFKRQRQGAIVCVASNAARVPRLGMAAYCASKAALAALSQCAALELAGYGVRCNLVSPGSTDTPMLQGLWADADGRRRTIDGSPEQFRLGIPLRKIATPDEIASAVLFLASDLASHITLHDLVVDGGATLAA